MNNSKVLIIALAALTAAACSSQSSAGKNPRAVTAEVAAIAMMPSPPPTNNTDANDGDDDDAIEIGTPLADESAGQRAPGFTAEPIERSDKPVRILKRKVTVVHFFATWCAPCKHSMPQLDKLQHKYARDGLMTLGVSVDDMKNDVRGYAKQNGIAFPVGWDKDHDIAQRYKVGTMPQTYVVDREGVIQGIFSGYHDGDDVDIEELIQKLL